MAPKPGILGKTIPKEAVYLDPLEGREMVFLSFVMYTVVTKSGLSVMQLWHFSGAALRFCTLV